MHSKFRDFIQERMKRLSDDEVAAANMKFLAEIDYDKVLFNYDDLKKGIDFLAKKIIEINSKLKETGRTREWKKNAKEEK